MPRPREAVDACGRALRRSAPALVTIAALALVASGLAFGHRFLTTSTRFAISEVEIHGSTVMTADEVRALMPFQRGDNIFRASTGAAERTLLALPWVAGVDVRRELPHRIVVQVRERTPAAVVAADELYLVDAAGHPFKRAAVERGEGKGLPIVSGVPRDLYQTDPEEAAARVRRGLEILAAWSAPENANSRPAAGEIAVEPSGTTVFTYDTAVAVRLGAAEGETLVARLARFDATWNALSTDERMRARAIHVDNDTRTDLVTVSFRTN
ncbi:MAG TPA: FtsQ-type POTRA domain-containing protein [Kofleriaceae bacterium]|nr:FtsQ-type POTRA domain-containing protein [Kofleriaceae bacterium]